MVDANWSQVGDHAVRFSYYNFRHSFPNVPNHTTSSWTRLACASSGAPVEFFDLFDLLPHSLPHLLPPAFWGLSESLCSPWSAQGGSQRISVLDLLFRNQGEIRPDAPYLTFMTGDMLEKTFYTTTHLAWSFENGTVGSEAANTAFWQICDREQTIIGTCAKWYQ